MHALINDLQWQIDQIRVRGVRDDKGKPYNPSHYRRGLENAIDDGANAVVEFVQKYLYKPPSVGYKKLEAANALDLACESLVADTSKPYADLFTDEDRAAASERLSAHMEAIEKRNAERRARIDAKRAEIRSGGMPERPDLSAAMRARRSMTSR